MDGDQTGVHHFLDQSGWTTFYLERPSGYDHARWLVRLSYLYHVNVHKKTPAGSEEYAAVDIESELDALAPSDAVRTAFERRRPGMAGAPDE
ncbi:luciferase family protein [Halorubrum sp. HHNYT27]|uniref:luciferase family protein n=1 Tax=Halorubrum sp. HHNYT27 TaxID=3402275 RepID=UPI003EC02C1B